MREFVKDSSSCSIEAFLGLYFFKTDTNGFVQKLFPFLEGYQEWVFKQFRKFLWVYTKLTFRFLCPNRDIVSELL
ncbi:hypothetical protein P872_19095 [Rhodonellum psychrophilum GCM71 = DSM 17998]|uniref:Uncharacterized protein n=1 Tax=Rhodonellum psychrophilum GCM71 = DSM 17998 TaxID=1123057 RepID=U5C0Q7_9BACT|nr:hypothetical protein P872_19095 [Rhodonellum psychrophilum GCM71 = DSM 17998]